MNVLDKISEIPDLHEKAINYVFENNMVNTSGLWLEFGVHGGGTINRISKYTTNTVYGFDSFEGLPEEWTGRVEKNGGTYRKGAFSLGGILPAVNENVKLVKGWYSEVLPRFMQEHQSSPITFVHIDSDIYSSARDIFSIIHPNLQNESIIVFDELIGYTNFEEHEWKAWWEFVNEHNIEFEWIGGNVSGVLNEPKPINERFDSDRVPGNMPNVSPAYENVAVRILNNPSYSI